MIEAHIVVGANYGDEGKGLTTSTLCHDSKIENFKVLNILTNGGSQRGHTVIDAYDKIDPNRKIYHVYHHFGSGTMYGVDNYYCDKFIINPMSFVKEYGELLELGFKFRRINVYADPNCRWSTPYDMIVNQFIEEYRGSNRHGSVGMGIWETVDRYTKIPSISIFEFAKLDPIKQKLYLSHIREYFRVKLSRIDGGLELTEPHKRFFESEQLMQHFISDCKFFSKAVTPISFQNLVNIGNYTKLVFENGQGLLLNSDENNVHTTPSNTGCIDSVNLLSELDSSDISVNVHYVTRPYLTRHGAGLLPGETELTDIQGIKLKPEITNKESKFQGKFRYANLDSGSLVKRIETDFKSCNEKFQDSQLILNLTHSDEIMDIEQFDSTAWLYDGVCKFQTKEISYHGKEKDFYIASYEGKRA